MTADAQLDEDALPGYEYSLSIWGRLGERFGLVALRPKLFRDVKVRRVDDEVELVQSSTGRLIDISPEEARIARRFDGSQTIAEIITAELLSGKPVAIDTALVLFDRVVRAGMVENFPPNMFKQLDNYLARTAVETQRKFRRTAQPDVVYSDDDDPGEIARRERESSGAPLSQYEQVPWRPRTPLVAERAQFLRTVELLKNLDSWAIGMLAEELHEETFPAASNVVTEGELADRFFIIRSGEINVTKLEEGQLVPKRIAKLNPGEWFGEIGLLEGEKRNANVRVGPSRPAQLFSFDANTFERLIAPHISSYRGRQRMVKRRDQLRKIELFAGLEQDDLDRLALAIREHQFPASTPVITQGEGGDRFYLVIEGSVGVVRDGVPVAKLTKGDFFGETALLFTDERTASIITIDDAVLWSIDKAGFTEMLRGHILRRRDMMPTLLNRLKE